MPLYTLWRTGTPGQIILYGLHCTLGDILIGFTALMLALLGLGNPDWPHRHYRRVAVTAIGLGLATTIFSEWYNVYRAANWAYSDLMPTVLGIGVSPLLQWLILPTAGFWWIRRAAVT